MCYWEKAKFEEKINFNVNTTLVVLLVDVGQGIQEWTK